MLTESTTGNVYGYISDVTQVWSCTAYYRYDAIGSDSSRRPPG